MEVDILNITKSNRIRMVSLRVFHPVDSSSRLPAGCSKGTVLAPGGGQNINFWTMLGLIYGEKKPKIIGFGLNFMIFGGKITVFY